MRCCVVLCCIVLYCVVLCCVVVCCIVVCCVVLCCVVLCGVVCVCVLESLSAGNTRSNTYPGFLLTLQLNTASLRNCGKAMESSAPEY